VNYITRDIQARVCALGFVTDVDGMNGPGTRKAVEAAMRDRRVKTYQELFHDSGIHSLVWHWTAGRDMPSREDLKHYNDVFDFEGNQYDGGARIEHQANYDWRKGVGVSHSKNANSGRGGLAVAGMHGAEGWPSLDWGDHPITWDGIDGMLKRSADYCKEFDIPVTKWSTLTHAEIETTLGIKQNNKWDYMVLPGDTQVRNAVVVGEILRDRLRTRFM
jgi:hypothetical protein